MEEAGEAPVPPSAPEMTIRSAFAFATPAAIVPTPLSATSFTLILACEFTFFKSIIICCACQKCFQFDNNVRLETKTSGNKHLLSFLMDNQNDQYLFPPSNMEYIHISSILF